MKKKLYSILLALILLIQPAFSLAQTTQPQITQADICGAPGETMLLYQKFQRDISSALLGGILGEKIFKSELNIMGLFTSKTLELPTTGNDILDTIANTLWKNTKRLTSATATTTVLLAIAGASVVSSNLEGFAILFQNRAIVRDWRSLLQIETRISQIAYTLGKRANLIGRLNEEGWALVAIVQQYVNEGLFTGSNIGKDKVNYAEILSSLTRMNAGMKMFLSFGNTSFLNRFGKFYGASFSEQALKDLKTEYAGARWPMDCSVMSKKIWSRLGNATSMVGNGAKEAARTIADASSRLVNALFKGSSWNNDKNKQGIAEQYFDKYELQQLRTIYGINTTQMTALDVPKYQRLIAPVGGWKKAINDIGKKTVSLIESTKNAGSEEKSFVDENFTETQKRQIMYKLGVSYNENFNTALLLDFADSIEKTNELFDRTTTNFILAENTSQTSQFYAIVKEIQDLERVINEGDKENNIPSLLDTLGKICEYQCVNKGNKGCR